MARIEFPKFSKVYFAPPKEASPTPCGDRKLPRKLIRDKSKEVMLRTGHSNRHLSKAELSMFNPFIFHTHGSSVAPSPIFPEKYNEGLGKAMYVSPILLHIPCWAVVVPISENLRKGTALSLEQWNGKSNLKASVLKTLVSHISKNTNTQKLLKMKCIHWKETSLTLDLGSTSSGPSYSWSIIKAKNCWAQGGVQQLKVLMVQKKKKCFWVLYNFPAKQSKAP